MSELEEKELEQSLFAQFEDAQETFEEAQERKEREETKFNRVKNFVMDKFDTYRLRILPLSPKDSRRGYEHPVRQMWLKINNPTTGKAINIKVCKATDAEISVDLIDTYKKVALKAFADDKDMQDKIKSGSFGGGLRYDYNHAMYVIDLEHPEDGLLVWEATNGQYKSLEDQKEVIWKKLIAKTKDPRYPCPISSYNKGFPVEITKRKNGKVEYVFTVDTFSGEMPLTEDQLKSLINAPLLSTAVKRYTKYHLEATIEFLKQYDDTIGENIMDSEEVRNAIEIIKGELPADDNSSFSMNGKESGSDDEVEEGLTFDSLSARFDELVDQGKTDKTEEGVKLREDIQAYIKSHNLSVMVKRTKTNMMLLDEIQAELEELGEEPDEVAPRQSTRVSGNEAAKHEPEEDDTVEDAEEEHPNQDSTAEPAVGRRRRR